MTLIPAFHFDHGGHYHWHRKLREPREVNIHRHTWRMGFLFFPLVFLWLFFAKCSGPIFIPLTIYSAPSFFPKKSGTHRPLPPYIKDVIQMFLHGTC